MGLIFEIVGFISDLLGLSFREQFPRLRIRRALKRAAARASAKTVTASGGPVPLPDLRELLAGLDEADFVDDYGNLVLRDSLVRRLGASEHLAGGGVDPGPLVRDLGEALLEQVRRLGGAGGALQHLHGRIQDARSAYFETALPAVEFTGSAFALPESDEPVLGREDDIADLLDHCRDAGGATIVWIHGEAGSGKTTLAAEFARRLDGRDGATVPLIRMRGASRQLGGGAYSGTDAHRLLADLLRNYDVIGADRLPEAELHARWKAVVRQRNVKAVVLDDVRDVGQVEPFLPGDAHCVIVVSSREYRPGLAARRCAIPALPTEVVLRHLVGFEDADAELVNGLIRGISAVPLMLPLVRSIGGRRRQGLGALLDKAGGSDFVGAAHRLVIDRLDARLRRTLGLLAGQPGFRLTADGLAALDEIGADEAAVRLESLAEQGLLKPGTGGSYAFHDRTYATVEAAMDDYVTPAELDRARLRLLRRRLEWARAVDDCFNDAQGGRPGVAAGLHLTAEEARNWLTFERRNLRESLRFHRDHGDAEARAAQTELARLVGAPLLRIGFTRDAELFLTAAVELAVDQDDRPGEAEARRLLGGRVFRMLDRSDEAERELALAGERYAELGDAEGQAGAANGLGHIARLRGDWDTAEGHLRRARKRYAELALDRGEADCLLGLAEITMLRPGPDLDRAFDLYRQAGRLFQDHYDMRGVAESCWGRAEAARMRGELETATRLYDTALDLARSNHDQLVEADTRRGMGDLAAAEGDDAAALEHFEAAVELYRRILDQVGTADALAGQGETLLRLGRRDDAAKAVEAAAELYSGIGHGRAGELRRLLRDQGLAHPAQTRRGPFKRKDRSAVPA